MREQLDSLTKDIGKVKDENASLAKENRLLKARDIAREAGFDPSRGELFASSNPEVEVTQEAVVEFVGKFNLASASSGAGSAEGASGGQGDPATDQPAGSADLTNMARGGSRPGDSAGGASTGKMTRQEWQELHANDPAKAREAVRQGQVEISSGNPFGDGRAVAVGANPYNKSA
jgi:hypothetical protein